jgi:pullulanase
MHQYSPHLTRFKLWSPVAIAVELRLYSEGVGGEAMERYNLEVAGEGWWQLNVYKDLRGMFYTYQVQTKEGWLEETPGVFATAVGLNGRRAAIIDLKDTNPEGWDTDKRPPVCSPVIYELHHRDFSISHSSGVKHKGRFLALTEHGTTSPEGLRTGIDHLVELGVTHVQLLPSFDFSSIDEADKNVPHYNWGYDPLNYNVPEGSYATDAIRPEVRIREFKQMVKALHDAGLRVVLDVVYNHVASVSQSAFERTVPGYFFRRKKNGDLANGSGCGNETASERAMMRHFIVESVAFWAEEYHIDGFRFDLMALHDVATMKAVVSRLHKVDKDICIYGEGWAAEAPQLSASQSVTKQNVYKIKGLAAFGDELRDALRGPFYDDTQGGFLLGNVATIPLLKLGLAGMIDYIEQESSGVLTWTKSPLQILSYVSCHDDLCLVDRLRSVSPLMSDEEVARLALLAHTAVFTAQGTPFLFAGEELLRKKRGVRNSYKSVDTVNAIDWRGKALHFDVFTYLRRLIEMRKAHPAFRMPTATKVKQNLHFLNVDNHCAVAFVLNGKAVGDNWERILVVLNAERQAIHVSVPMADYTVVCRDGRINLGNREQEVRNKFSIPPQSALIAWSRENSSF